MTMGHWFMFLNLSSVSSWWAWTNSRDNSFEQNSFQWFMRILKIIPKLTPFFDIAGSSPSFDAF